MIVKVEAEQRTAFQKNEHSSQDNFSHWLAIEKKSLNPTESE